MADPDIPQTHPALRTAGVPDPKVETFPAPKGVVHGSGDKPVAKSGGKQLGDVTVPASDVTPNMGGTELGKPHIRHAPHDRGTKAHAQPVDLNARSAVIDPSQSNPAKSWGKVPSPTP